MRWQLGGMMSVFVLAAACNGATSSTTSNANDDVVGTSASPIVLTQGIAASAPRTGIEQLLNADRDAVASEAIAYLHTQRDALGMRSPKDELSVIHALVDQLSMTHIRFNQVERGVRVDGGNLNVHFDADGRLSSIQNHYVPNLASLSVTPGITADEASAFALADRNAIKKTKNALSVVGTPELVIFARGSVTTPTLVWELRVKGSFQSDWTMRVDAQTGAIVQAASRIHDLTGSGTGLDGKTHPVNYLADTTDSTNVLTDQSRPSELDYFDAQNSITDPTQIGIITSTTPSTWDATSTLGAGSAVSAQGTIGTTVDFYQKTFQRAGWLGDSSEMNIILHMPNDDGTPGLDNAYYSPAPDNFIAIGDGSQQLKPLAQFLDVLAHEFTHGVTGSHAALNEDNQPDALNESISDCFGAIVEHSVAPDPVKNWQIGEGTQLTTAAPLRDMAHPGQNPDGAQPSNMSGFDATTNADPHSNAGITSYAAYLATVGGTEPTSKITVKNGFGWDNFAQVWYRADTVYLTSTSSFSDMAAATAKAAADLKLSDADTATLACAWIAVGVTQGTCKQAASTQSQSPTSGSASSSGDDDGDSSSKKKTSAPTSAAAPGTPSSSAGCSATSGSSSGGGFALALAAIAVLAAKRRRKAA